MTPPAESLRAHVSGGRHQRPGQAGATAATNEARAGETGHHLAERRA